MDNPDCSVIVVTGTSRGLGLQLAQLFLDAGNQVFGCSRSPSPLQSEMYQHATVDIGDELQVRSWVRQIKKDAGKIDVLVCNAGLMSSVLPFTMTPAKVLEDYLRINVAGSFFVLREVGKVMAVQQSGRIVAISSVMTRLHEPGTSVYSATKAAIEQMIKVYARELSGANVTCNIVAPGLIATEAADIFGDEWHQNMLNLQTIKRPVTVDEIYHAISFYTSSSAAVITGQTLYLGVVN